SQAGGSTISQADASRRRADARRSRSGVAQPRRLTLSPAAFNIPPAPLDLPTISGAFLHMRSRSLLALVATPSLLLGLGACDGLKEALTAHVDVAGKADNQDLSVTRLADLLGNAKVPVPITKENAGIVADLWVNYQLLAHAAAVGDSLNDKKAIDPAMQPITKNMLLRKCTDTLVKSFKVDSGSEATYNQAAGDLYA